MTSAHPLLPLLLTHSGFPATSSRSILNANHPDIEHFISAKAQEEKKAHTLIEAGYDASLDGDAYSSIFVQNANNTVRVTDDFMQAVEADGPWSTKSVITGQPLHSYQARDRRDNRTGEQ
jgi:ribonucleoside-diphosphate reductase alpha chain